MQRGKVSIRNIQMLNAILYVAKHGCKWLGLPKRFRDGTPSAKGSTLMCHQGIDVQCKCIPIICYSTRLRYFRWCTRLRHRRALCRQVLLHVVSVYASSRAIPRMDSPLRCAFRTLPIWSPVAASAFCAAEPQLCEVFQCHSRRTCQGSFRHRVWRPSL